MHTVVRTAGCSALHLCMIFQIQFCCGMLLAVFLFDVLHFICAAMFSSTLYDT